MTPFFFGQGINYRTVANQFGIAETTVCRIVHKKAKAIVDNLTPECVKFSESDAKFLDALVTFQGKHIPNRVGAIDRSHIVISCSLPSEGLISTIGRHTTPLGICDGDGKFLSII